MSLLEEISKFYHVEAINVSQPMLATSEHKMIIYESFKQVSTDLLSHALCSEADAHRIAEALYNFSYSPSGFCSRTESATNQGAAEIENQLEQLSVEY